MGYLMTSGLLFFLITATSFSTTPQIHNTTGLAYFYQGKYAQAFEEFLSAARKDPNNVIAHFNLGRIFERQAKYKDAFIQYQRTLSLDPGHDQARIGYQKLIRFREQVKLRVKSNDEVLEEKINKKDIRSEVAKEKLLNKRIRQIDEYFARKNYRAALDVTQRGLRFFPQNGDLQLYLGRYYFIEEQYARCVGEIRKAIENGVSEPDVAFYLLALAYENLGDFEKAERALRKAVDLAPSNSVFYDRLGIILQKLNKDPKAVSNFREGVRINPTSVDTRVRLNKLSKELSLKTFHNGKLKFEEREYPAAKRLLREALDYGQLSPADMEEALMLVKISDYWLNKKRKIERVRVQQVRNTQDILHEEKVTFADATNFPREYMGRYVQWRGRVIHIKEKSRHYELLVDMDVDNEYQEDLEMQSWILVRVDGKRPDDTRLSYLSEAEIEGKYKNRKFIKNPWNGQVSIRRQPVVYLTEGKFSHSQFGPGVLRVFPDIDYRQ